MLRGQVIKYIHALMLPGGAFAATEEPEMIIYSSDISN